MPCVWLRTSQTVHKIAITTATLLVTSLLVASPVLFLLSTAPSQLPKDCNVKNDINCLPTRPPAPECGSSQCRGAALGIQARMHWKVDPCKDFKDFSCSSVKESLKAVKSAQESVDFQMQRNVIPRYDSHADSKLTFHFQSYSFTTPPPEYSKNLVDCTRAVYGKLSIRQRFDNS